MALPTKNMAHKPRARRLGFCNHDASSRHPAIAKAHTAMIRTVKRSRVMTMIFVRRNNDLRRAQMMCLASDPALYRIGEGSSKPFTRCAAFDRILTDFAAGELDQADSNTTHAATDRQSHRRTF